jgi:hypothetical protein
MRYGFRSVLLTWVAGLAAPVGALAQDAPATVPVDNSAAPTVAFDAVDFIRLKPGQNLGEVLGIAVSSRGDVVILNHPGTATTGPLYGNATTEILQFDKNGRLVREIGHGVYALGYSHSVRFDRHDNLWVVDKGTDSVIEFDSTGKVMLNLGRRPEGFDSGHEEHLKQSQAVPVDGWFRAPTDVAWDQDDNLQTDREGNVYVADRGNRRIHVYDRDGNFERFMFLNAPYDKSRHPVLGNAPSNPDAMPNQSAPWALCITPTTPQYLFVVDAEPGRLYKMTLDGKILAMLGQSGHRMGQFNWPHALACPGENTVLVADMNNWRVQKITLHPEKVVH